MKLRGIKTEKFLNTKNWELIEKHQNEKMTVLRLGHLNPECNIDSTYAEANKVIKEEKRGNVIETTSTVGISTKKGKLSNYYDAMIEFARVGMLGDFTVEQIEKHRKEMNKHMPEEYDLWTDISIADYTTPKIASQALKNMADQFSKGFANISIPGALDGANIKEIFQNPLVIEEAKKQGVDDKEIEDVLKKIEKVSKQAVKQVKDSGLRYEVGKFKKYPAVYSIPPIKPKKQKISKKSNNNSNKGQGGGFSDLLRLPPNAFEKEDYPIGGKLLQAIQIGNYILTGSILVSMNCLPSEKLYCQSLTKFKTVTKRSRDGNMTFIDHYIVPLDSSLRNEGYVTREEVEEMILKLIEILLK